MSKESRQPWELDFATAEREFARAWLNPAYTQIELEPIKVNGVLREAYTLTQPLTFTRAMLWDIEVRKARDPQSYIPSVVQEGQIWSRRFLANGRRFSCGPRSSASGWAASTERCWRRPM